MSGGSSPSRKPNKQRLAPFEPTATFEPPSPEHLDALTDMGRKNKSKSAPPKTIEPQPPEPSPHNLAGPTEEDDGSEYALYRKQRNLFSDQFAACATKAYCVNHVAASVRIFVALFHAISAFRVKFQREPPMSLVADALTNAAMLRSVRNSDILTCRICKVDGGTPSNLAATFSLPLLLLHVETHHSERVDLMATLAKNCTLEWFQSVISLPARGNIEPLLTQESVKERDTLAIFRSALSYIPAEETVTIRNNPLLSFGHAPTTLPRGEARHPTIVTDPERIATREELNIKIEPDGCINPLEVLGRRQVATATRDFGASPRHPEPERRPQVVTLHDHEQQPRSKPRSRSPPLDRQRLVSAYRERDFPAFNPPRAREPRPYVYAHSLPPVLYDEFGNQYVRTAPNPYVLYSEPPPRRT